MIRFQRVGRKNDPAFRVVVTEKRSKPKSGELEIVGSYYPKTKETRLKSERVLYWLSKGAKTSPRVHNLLISKGAITGRKLNVVKKNKEEEKPLEGTTLRASSGEPRETTEPDTEPEAISETPLS